MTQDQLRMYDREFHMYSNGLDITKHPKYVLLDFFTILEIYGLMNAQLKKLFDGGLIRVESADVKQALSRSFFDPDVPEGYYDMRITPTTAGLVQNTYYLNYLTLPHFIQSYFEPPV